MTGLLPKTGAVLSGMTIRIFTIIGMDIDRFC
jgi:hypothetical protein